MNDMKTWIVAMSVGGAVVAGAPAMAAEGTRTVPAFSAVDFNGIGRMNVTVGETQSLAIVGSKRTLEQVTTTVEDGTLQVKWVDRKEKHGWLWRFAMPDDDDSDKITVNITIPKLHKISVAGAASVVAKGIESDTMDFSVSGAAKIRADGHADKLSLSISGAGSADLDHLVAKEANVSISGAGKADVNARERLRGDISGVGSIRYEGEPKVTSSISGAGSIRAK